jgi:hypothetical protein
LLLIHFLGIETHRAFGVASACYEKEDRLEFSFRAHCPERTGGSFFVHFIFVLPFVLSGA